MGIGLYWSLDGSYVQGWALGFWVLEGPEEFLTTAALGLMLPCYWGSLCLLLLQC